jgi:hypothetical protein
MAVFFPVSMNMDPMTHRMVMVVGMRRHHNAEGGERRSAGKDRFLHRFFPLFEWVGRASVSARSVPQTSEQCRAPDIDQERTHPQPVNRKGIRSLFASP